MRYLNTVRVLRPFQYRAAISSENTRKVSKKQFNNNQVQNILYFFTNFGNNH